MSGRTKAGGIRRRVRIVCIAGNNQAGANAMQHATKLFAGLVLVLFAAAAQAQGLLVVIDPQQQVALPRPIVAPEPAPPPTGYKIKELAVQARLVDQVARVQVLQSFVNTGSQPLEASFIFPLPYDG